MHCRPVHAHSYFVSLLLTRTYRQEVVEAVSYMKLDEYSKKLFIIILFSQFPIIYLQLSSVMGDNLMMLCLVLSGDVKSALL